MKVFLHIFLYLSVSVCSLFFVIWVLTSSPFVEKAAAADPNNNSLSPAPPASSDVQRTPSESSSPSPNNVETNSAPAVKPVTPPQPENKDSASAAEPAPPQPENKDSASAAEPAPPQPENKDSASAAEPAPPQPENKDSASAEPIPPPPPIPEPEKDSLSDILDSGSQFHEDKGSNKDMVNDLMNLNKKVVDMYKMLSDYQYDMTDRRDPFTPFREVKEVPGKNTILDTRNCPGKNYALNDIKLVGIQWGAKGRPNKAYFRSPGNESFFLQKNDCLGQSKATIYKIQEGRVVFIVPRTLNPDKISSESAFSLIEVSLSRNKGLVSK